MRWMAFVAIVYSSFAAASESHNVGGLSRFERAKCMGDVEEVFYDARLWPRKNSTAKPLFSAIVSDATLLERADDVLRMGDAMTKMAGQSLSVADFQQELDRIVAESQDRVLLDKIFSILDYNAYLIAECLIRPQITATRLSNIYRESGDNSKDELLQDMSARTVISSGLKDFHQWWESARPSYFPVTPVLGGRPLVLRTHGLASPQSSKTTQSTAWQWTNEAPPVGREGHTAVWTGTEMIVWGVTIGEAPYSNPGANTGGRYRPATNSWHEVTLNGAPAMPRNAHTAIWTGSEMVIWGGGDGGARYNPLTDSWSSMSTTNAPIARAGHTAVWTGSEMIIWGGFSRQSNSNLNSGGRYRPDLDAWQPVSQTLAPTARDRHTAVWTGSEMLIWGGRNAAPGGRYSPVTNSWVGMTTTDAPTPRIAHTAVWTGNKMMIWGGKPQPLNVETSSGSLYDPSSNTWSSVFPPPLARSHHSAVWTGSRVLVWGGKGSGSERGASFDPVTNVWDPLPSAGAPTIRSGHSAIWTGQEMILWGGAGYSITTGPFESDGARFNPQSGVWTTMSFKSDGGARQNHVAVWTGAEMIVWGGQSREVFDSQFGYIPLLLNTGARFIPATSTWTSLTTVGAPSPRAAGLKGAWSGNTLIVWGGRIDANQNQAMDGGRFNPTLNNWSGMSTANAPTTSYTRLWGWSGGRFIIWNGGGNSGGLYDPVANVWSRFNLQGEPGLLTDSVVGCFAEDRLIVWGARSFGGTQGAIYTVADNSWAPISSIGSPALRSRATGVWDGTGCLVWGGDNNDIPVSTGGRYDLALDAWSAVSNDSVPPPRTYYSAIWAGNRMLIWGGRGPSGKLEGGGAYDPSTNTWSELPTSGAPFGRRNHHAVWTGSQVVFFGGEGDPTLSGLFVSMGAIGRLLPVSMNDMFANGFE